MSLTQSKNRNSNIDLIRGFAIILMIFDHALLAYSSIYGNNDFIYLFRITLTRFSMPLFMIISGTVLILYGLKIKRWLSVFIIALVLNIITINLWEDFNSPEILLVWCFVVIFYKIYLKFPIIVLILGYIQTQFFQITFYDYSGYQPGDIIIFLIVGIFASKYITGVKFPILSKLSIIHFISFIGSKPLTIYFSHLLLLSIIIHFLTI
jgi:uncharacterized membrane protein